MKFRFLIMALAAGSAFLHAEPPQQAAQSQIKAQQQFDGAGPRGFSPDPDPTTHIDLEVKPAGLVFSPGVFGLQTGTEFFAPSFYGSIDGKWMAPPTTPWHWGVRVKTGYLMLRSRLAGPENPETAAQLNDMRDYAANSEASQQQFAGQLMARIPGGASWRQQDKDAYFKKMQPWSEQEKKNIQDFLNAAAPGSADFRVDHLLFAGIQAELARGFHLFGPIDLAAGVTAIVDTWTNFSSGPLFLINGQTDITAGLRIKYPGSDFSAGLFGGWAQNYSPLSEDITNDFLTTYKTEDLLGFHFDHAPHFGFGFWGPVPGGSNLYIEEQSRFQYNTLSQEQEHQLRLTGTVNNRILEGHTGFYWEDGSDIDYTRARGSAGFGATLFGLPNWDMTAGIDGFAEYINYGGASLNQGGIMLSLGAHGDLGPVKVRARGAYSTRFASGRKDPGVSEEVLAQRRASEEKFRTDPLLGHVYSQYLNLSGQERINVIKGVCESIVQVNPGQFGNTLPTTPGSESTYVYYNPPLRKCMDVLAGTPFFEGAVKATQDPRLLNQLAMRAAKNLGGASSGDVFMGAALVNRRLSPIGAITARQRHVFKEWLMHHLNKFLEIDTAANFNSLSYNGRIRELSEYLRNKTLGGDAPRVLQEGELDALVEALLNHIFDIVNQQGNRELLERLLAGEQLNIFSVTQGQKAPEVNRGSVIKALEKSRQ